MNYVHSHISTCDACGFDSTYFLTGELRNWHNRLIACVSVTLQRGLNCVLLHAYHMVNYTRRVYYMQQVNVVNANTYWDLVYSHVVLP